MIQEYVIDIGKTYDTAPACWQNFISTVLGKHGNWYNMNTDAVHDIVTNELNVYNARRETLLNSDTLYFKTERDRTVFILKWGFND